MYDVPSKELVGGVCRDDRGLVLYTLEVSVCEVETDAGEGMIGDGFMLRGESGVCERTDLLRCMYESDGERDRFLRERERDRDESSESEEAREPSSRGESNCESELSAFDTKPEDTAELDVPDTREFEVSIDS